MLDEDMLKEFITEAEEMFDEAEQSLLQIDQEDNFQENFNSIFRCYHSIKGAAGMFGHDLLQKHMHFLENLLEKYKDDHPFKEELVNYFLKGTDAAREIMALKEVEFDLYDPLEEGSPSTGSDSPVESETQKEVFVSDDSVPVGEDTPTETTNKEESSVSSELSDEVANNASLSDESSQESRPIIINLLDDDAMRINTIKSYFSNSEYFEFKISLSLSHFLNDIDGGSTDVVLLQVGQDMAGIQDKVNQIKEKFPSLPIICLSDNYSAEGAMDVITQCGVYCYLDSSDATQIVINCFNACHNNNGQKLLEKSFDLILLKNNALDDYLKKEGEESLRATFKEKVESLLTQKDDLDKQKLKMG